jgi:hypothetical protein
MYHCHARFPFHADQTPLTTTLSCRRPRSKCASLIEDIESDEETLVEEFGIDGAAAEEVLGYDPDNDEEEADEEEEEEDQDDEDEGDEDDKAFEELRKRVRLEATQQSEANRRAGGIKTQRAMVRAWEVRFHFSFCLDPSELMKMLRNLSKSHWRRRKSVTT